MPLDSAQFISELSIDDPPGTDPLNQGDDQIRTTKRATQQSFPNVDAAVPQTAAQMAQMAIKNEVNTFTQDQTFNARLFGASGTAPLPTYSFTTRQGHGMYAKSSIELGFAVSGVERLGIQASVMLVQSNTIQAQAGNAAAPAYTFQTDPTLGIYHKGLNELGFSVNATEKLLILNTASRFTDRLEVGFGTESAPGHGFNLDSDTGMYRISANVLGFTCGGQEKMRLDALGALTLERGGVLLDDVTGGQTATVNWRRGGVNRFRLVMLSDAGGNDLELVQHTDAGATLGKPFVFKSDTGLILMATLPTSNPGVANALWNNSGFVAVSP